MRLVTNMVLKLWISEARIRVPENITRIETGMFAECDICHFVNRGTLNLLMFQV